jgi:hypothetical protein
MTPPIPAHVAERAATRYLVEGDCFISTYSVGSHGYAQIGWQLEGTRKTAMTTAHRAAWVHHNDGAQPGEMTVDHTCRNRRCVRREHLRLLSNDGNARRNQPSVPEFAAEVECSKGHPASARVPIKRKTKRGETRIGWTCGTCVADSRRRYEERYPERVKASKAAYAARKRAS